VDAVGLASVRKFSDANALNCNFSAGEKSQVEPLGLIGGAGSGTRAVGVRLDAGSQ
jgi:hypothetical protein